MITIPWKQLLGAFPALVGISLRLIRAAGPAWRRNAPGAPRRNALGEGRAAGSGGAEHFRRPPASLPHGRVCGECGPGREPPGGRRGRLPRAGGGRGRAGRPPGVGRAAAPQRGERAGAAAASRGSRAGPGRCGAVSCSAASAPSCRALGQRAAQWGRRQRPCALESCLELPPVLEELVWGCWVGFFNRGFPVTSLGGGFLSEVAGCWKPKEVWPSPSPEMSRGGRRRARRPRAVRGAWKVPQPLDQFCFGKGLGPDGLQKFLLQPKLFAEFQPVCWLWLEKLVKSGRVYFLLGSMAAAPELAPAAQPCSAPSRTGYACAGRRRAAFGQAGVRGELRRSLGTRWDWPGSLGVAGEGRGEERQCTETCLALLDEQGLFGRL